jgi:hypothetical protein
MLESAFLEFGSISIQGLTWPHLIFAQCSTMTTNKQNLEQFDLACQRTWQSVVVSSAYGTISHNHHKAQCFILRATESEVERIARKKNTVEETSM